MWTAKTFLILIIVLPNPDIISNEETISLIVEYLYRKGNNPVQVDRKAKQVLFGDISAIFLGISTNPIYSVK